MPYDPISHIMVLNVDYSPLKHEQGYRHRYNTLQLRWYINSEKIQHGYDEDMAKTIYKYNYMHKIHANEYIPNEWYMDKAIPKHLGY